MTHYEKALKYVADNLTREEAEWATRNEVYRFPIEQSFVDKVYDYMEEYGADNDLPEAWWLSYADEEETAYKVVDLLFNL